ncbi:MAG: thioredoxin family protein [Planctomycetota bacterium]|jgi:thioredoxin 1
MTKFGKIIIVVALVAAVALVITIKGTTKSQNTKQQFKRPSVVETAVTVGPNNTTTTPQLTKAVPRLVDLGAGKCVPCKMMAPILEELKSEYEGVLKVEFIDVWENPEAGKEYGIRLIPTQIFYDSTGRELFRHEGFFSKEDILAKWKELGVELAKTK